MTFRSKKGDSHQCVGALPVPVSFLKLKPLILAMATLAVGGATCSVSVSADVSGSKLALDTSETEKNFNLDVLRQRGIDPKVAKFFSKKPRFAEGIRRVTLWVNGVSRGTVDAHFDVDGQLCFTLAILDQGGLKVPENQVDEVGSGPDQCYDFIKAFPQTEVELRPGREEVSLVVSVETLRLPSEDGGGFQSGGVAGLLNYEVLGAQNTFGEMSTRYTSLNTELGFNAGDWLLRSRQSFNEQDGVRSSQVLYTFAQKTFVSHKAMLQVGEINIGNSVFPGAAITGLQVLPDTALHGQGRGGASVEGIAQSQARVEIRQAGMLIHTTLVPAGPFRLPDIQLLNGNTDLDVRVIEANGEQRNFTVAAASLAQFSYTAPGFSMAVGQVRTFDSPDIQSPMVVTGTQGWLLNPRNRLSAGLMLSQNQYQGVAFIQDSAITPGTSVNWRGTVANAGEEGAKGVEASIGISARLTKKLSTSIDFTRRTEGFRSLLDTTQELEAGYTNGLTREQYGVSLNWTDPVLGGFSLGYSKGTSFSGFGSQHINGSWGKRFKHFSVSANVERSMSRGGDKAGWGSANKAENAAYLNVSIPLGSSRSMRTYTNKRNGSTRFGASFSDSSNDFGSYQVSADSNTEDRQRDFSGSINLTPRYTSLGLGYSKYGENDTSYSGHLSGGVALHGGGLTLSPYQVKDTFAVAEVGDVSGVKLSTPSGPVWTDLWGQAVVSELNPYKSSSVEIVTKTLPRNVDIKNGSKALTAGRGSVNKLDFPTITTRRVLLKARDLQGEILTKGASVFNGEDQFLTTVTSSGKIFLNDGQLDERLVVSLDGNKRCVLEYSLPDEANPDVYFESADATCKPL